MKKAEWHRLKRLNERFPQRGEARARAKGRATCRREREEEREGRGGEGGREGGLRNQKGFGPGERGERGEGEDSSASTRHYVAAGTNLYKGGGWGRGRGRLRVNRARGAEGGRGGCPSVALLEGPHPNWRATPLFQRVYRCSDSCLPPGITGNQKRETIPWNGPNDPRRGFHRSSACQAGVRARAMQNATIEEARPRKRNTRGCSMI
jgi:hypothetical protein